MSFDPPEERYRRDPLFKHFVDVIHAMLEKSEMSPSEVREGAMLACIHFEMWRVRHPMMAKALEQKPTSIGGYAGVPAKITYPCPHLRIDYTRTIPTCQDCGHAIPVTP